MGNCATKPVALDDVPLPLEKPPSMHGSSVDGDAYKEEEEEAAATTKCTSPEREPLLKSKEVEEFNKNGTSEAQKDVALKNAENVVSETHTLASEPAEGKKEVMHHEITDEATTAKPDQGSTVVDPQALTKDDDQVHIEDKDVAFDKPKDPEAIIIGTPQENAASVEPEDSKAKVQAEAQDIDAVVKESKDKAATIVASPQENPAPLETQENDAAVTKPKDNEATVNAEPVESSATKAPKEKKKGDVFHNLFTMYNNLVKKP